MSDYEIAPRTFALKPEITEALSNELLHQSNKYGDIIDRGLSVGDYIVIMEGELQEAKEGFLKQREDGHSALEEIVQVAATAIACLAKHGLKGN